ETLGFSGEKFRDFWGGFGIFAGKTWEFLGENFGTFRETFWGFSREKADISDERKIGNSEEKSNFFCSEFPRFSTFFLRFFFPKSGIFQFFKTLFDFCIFKCFNFPFPGTVSARVLLLPLVLRGQREAARLSRHLPQLQKLSQRLAEARRGADPNQVAVAYSQLASYQRRHDVNPLRGFLVPLVQTPLFVSFFLALQGLAAAPAPGLLRGGLGWFPDLAAPDPFYVLPVLVTASTWLVLELGAETGVAAPGAGPVRQILRFLPLAFLPFILHFPTAVFTYWLTSNAFSLLQTGLLRVPALRAKLGVAPPLAPPPAPPTGPAPPAKPGLLQQLKKGEKWGKNRIWGNLGDFWGNFGIFGKFWGFWGKNLGILGRILGNFGKIWGKTWGFW
uniref:Membrane insertase YidC/Oxa/ALB C-terminal domain-containing protein n=1 Tax=Cyanoderma ruficeps TaxID=181631 RepID=A0A8C3QFM4_9PASS